MAKEGVGDTGENEIPSTSQAKRAFQQVTTFLESEAGVAHDYSDEQLFEIFNRDRKDRRWESWTWDKYSKKILGKK